jgi:uncharacterized protein (TIGR02466 family)
MQIASLFPIPVASFQLARPLSEVELACICGQPTMASTGSRTTSSSRILDEPELEEIRAFIESSLQEILLRIYNPGTTCGLRITQSWCSYIEGGGYHLMHSHPNSFLSGVFYFKADPKRDSIRFFRHEHQPYMFPTARWNRWIAGSCRFPARPGDLLTFPSSLLHQVDPINGERMCVSLAFNTFPTGELGDERELTLLQLPHIQEHNGHA